LSWLVSVMQQGMEYFFQLTGNYGIAIIILTVVIRVVLLPFTFSQVKAMKKMQELQPELKKLQNKYKNDPQRLNKETMELWKKHGVNPFSGCLPLLLQIPFLWAFFRMLYSYEPLIGAPFLWLSDLSLPDPTYILPVLAAVTTYWQSKIMSPAGVDASQQTMLYMMPIFLGWLASQYAAGLSLYWVVSNLLGILQQYLMPVGSPVKGEST